MDGVAFFIYLERLYSEISQHFQFYGPTTPTLHRLGKTWRAEPLVDSSAPSFTRVGVTCRPCGAKDPQNRLFVM